MGFSRARVGRRSAEDGQPPQRDDIQAELTLHGLEPPYKLVQDELNAITEAAAGAVAEMDEIAKEELNSEVMNFIRQEKSRSN